MRTVSKLIWLKMQALRRYVNSYFREIFLLSTHQIYILLGCWWEDLIWFNNDPNWIWHNFAHFWFLFGYLHDCKALHWKLHPKWLLRKEEFLGGLSPEVCCRLFPPHFGIVDLYLASLAFVWENAGSKIENTTSSDLSNLPSMEGIQSYRCCSNLRH